MFNCDAKTETYLTLHEKWIGKREASWELTGTHCDAPSPSVTMAQKPLTTFHCYMFRQNKHHNKQSSPKGDHILTSQDKPTTQGTRNRQNTSTHQL
jgi:hypothetical protein